MDKERDIFRLEPKATSDYLFTISDSNEGLTALLVSNDFQPRYLGNLGNLRSLLSFVNTEDSKQHGHRIGTKANGRCCCQQQITSAWELAHEQGILRWLMLADYLFFNSVFRLNLAVECTSICLVRS